MKYVKQFSIITFIALVGEALKYALPFSVPSSVYGLLLLFILLQTKIITVSSIRETSEFLIHVMPVMFIPISVRLLYSWADLSPVILPVLIIVVITTVVVMLSTGWLTEKLLKERRDE